MLTYLVRELHFDKPQGVYLSEAGKCVLNSRPGLVQHDLGLARTTLQKGDAGGPQGLLGPCVKAETTEGRVEAIRPLPGGTPKSPCPAHHTIVWAGAA